MSILYYAPVWAAYNLTESRPVHLDDHVPSRAVVWQPADAIYQNLLSVVLLIGSYQ